jgi:hypothetical protein
MKKNILLLIALVTAFAVNAQGISGGSRHIPGGEFVPKRTIAAYPHLNLNSHASASSSRAATYSFYLDYDGVDNEYANIALPSPSDYSQFIWGLNRRFPNDSSFTIRWAAQIFDTLFDYTTNTVYPFDRYPTASTQLTVDTILVRYGHIKTVAVGAGTRPDTIVVRLFKNDTLNTLLQATGISAEQVWSQTIIVDTSMTGPGSGPGTVNTGTLVFAPGIALPTGSTFSVQVDFYGPVSDEFYVLAGYRDACAAACAGNMSQVGSRFGSGMNSWGEFVYKPATGTGFQAFNHDVNIDCNSNSVVDDANCENFYIQNYAIYPKVTAVVEFSGNIIADRTEGCPGEVAAVDLSIYGASGASTVAWTPTTGVDNPAAEDVNITIPASGTVTYTATITNGVNVTTATFVLKSNGVTVNAGADQTVACGATANLSAVASGVTTGITYSWSNGKTTSANSGVDGGTYTITVTNNKGCSATDVVVVTHPGETNTVGFAVPSPICASSTYGNIFPNTSLVKTGWNFTWTNLSTSATTFTEDGNLIFSTAGPVTIKLTAEKAGCVYSTQANVVVKAASDPLCRAFSIDDQIFANNVTIYPNPNNGTFELNVEGANETIEITIFDSKGQTVYTSSEAKTNSLVKTLDMSKASKGVYFVKVQSGVSVTTKKLVIN